MPKDRLGVEYDTSNRSKPLQRHQASSALSSNASELVCSSYPAVRQPLRDDKQTYDRKSNSTNPVEDSKLLILKGMSHGLSWESVSHMIENSQSFTSDKLENSLVKIPQVLLDEALMQQTSTGPPYISDEEEANIIEQPTLDLGDTLPSYESLSKTLLGDLIKTPTEAKREIRSTQRTWGAGIIRGSSSRPRTSSLLPTSKPSGSRTLSVNGASLTQKPFAGRPFRVVNRLDKEEGPKSRLETYIPMPKTTETAGERSPSVQRSENDDSRLLRVDDEMLINYLIDHVGFSKLSSPGTRKPSARDSVKSLDLSLMSKAPQILQDLSQPPPRRGGSDFLIKLRQRTPEITEGPVGTSETPTTYRVDSPAKQQTSKRSSAYSPKSFKEVVAFQGQTDDLEDYALSSRQDTILSPRLDMLISPRQEVSVLRPKVSVGPAKLANGQASPAQRSNLPLFSPNARHFSASSQRGKKSDGKLCKGPSLKPVPHIKARFLRSLRLSSV